jgi:hypothetical protein
VDRAAAWARRRVAIVTLVGLVAAAVLVGGEVAAQRPDCCAGRKAVSTLYSHRLTGVNRLLATGDGQVFATLARDPLLERPEVFYGRDEFAYRAGRPLWGYAAWALSAGQPGAVGWALAVLAVVAAGAATAVTALLLRRRGASEWWALAVPVLGFESLAELTPELAAFALFGLGVLWWTSGRRWPGVGAFVAAGLTRETMLVGVVALAAWELVERRRAVARAVRELAPLALPFAAYGAWVGLLRVRVGAVPSDAAGGRVAALGSGFVHALADPSARSMLVLAAALTVTVVGAALVVARRDVVTWVVVGYLLFASTFSTIVWTGHFGFTRVLLPLFGFGLVAVAGGYAGRRDAPAGATVHGLGAVVVPGAAAADLRAG